MIVSLILLTAAGSLMAPAHRLKLKPRVEFIPDTRVVPVMHHGPMIQTPVNVLRPQMQEGASDDDILELGYTARGGVVFPLGSDTQISPQPLPPPIISHQPLPPPIIHGLDIRQLQHNWATCFVDPIEEESAESPSTLRKVDDYGLPSQLKTLKYWPDDNAIVLCNMCFVIAESTEYFKQLDLSSHYLKVLSQVLRTSHILEMVGLIPKGLQMTFLESGSSAVDESMLAIGVFSREKLWDDSRGSLRAKVDMQYGKQGTRPWLGHSEQRLDVFLIQGIANAPGLPNLSARVLLSKIEKYAQKEQKIVVVAKDAYIYFDGTDLTDHYVGLGFEKVEMEDGLSELVYKGTSSAEHVWVEKRQVMVGLNLWESSDLYELI